jgi:serine/threonine protein phosphatase 1
MTGRIIAVGDVHGCHRALLTLLGALAVTSADTVVFVGDAVDRGPSSKQVIDEILSLSEMCKVVFIMGNHEEMMRDAIAGRGLLNEWLRAGGQATLDSYGCSIDKIPPRHIRFLVSAQPFWVSDNDIFVHACVEPDISMANQASEFLRWKHLGGSEPPHVSGKRIICGHTSQTDGVPLIFDGWVCIDTFPHGGKWLTGLDVDSNHIIQASQDGKVRDFPLSKYA